MAVGAKERQRQQRSGADDRLRRDGITSPVGIRERVEERLQSITRTALHRAAAVAAVLHATLPQRRDETAPGGQRASPTRSALLCDGAGPHGDLFVCLRSGGPALSEQLKTLDGN